MRPLVKVPVKYGVIAGFLGALLMISLYYMNRHPFLIPVYFDFRIILFGVFVFFTLKELRDYHQQGMLYFAQGVLCSFVFVAVYAVVASMLVGLFSVAVPEFVATYVKLQTKLIKGLPPEVIERIGKDSYNRNLETLPSTNAFDLASLYFTQSFFIGLFISIILSVILRRQPKT
jgi:hypothetical protein